MLLGIGVFLCCVVFVASDRPAYADHIDKIINDADFGGRISDNIKEDARLDLPSLVRKYNYPFEEHSVTTKDGYILGLHRIPHGRVSNSTGNRPVVFLMHGLFSSSADYIVMGPGSALAYILAEEGFDVWMGNARGNYFSRRNVRLNPDSLISSAFWQFTWDEIGNIDVPASIDYILENTGRSALHYIGFSQGTTCFYVMASLQPAYNKKIISMHAMAPVAYTAHVKNPLFHLMAPFEKQILAWATRKGFIEFLPRSEIMSWVGETFCKDGAVTQPMCTGILFFIAGISTTQYNSTMLPVVLGHTPAGASLKQLAHYGQGVTGKQFKRYDFGLIGNLREYGRSSPPSYDLSKVSAPVFLHYSDTDPLADVRDVDRLFAELGNPVGRFRIQMTPFSHLDFVWGNDANTLVYSRMINIMKTLNRE